MQMQNYEGEAKIPKGMSKVLRQTDCSSPWQMDNDTECHTSGKELGS